MTKPKSIRIEAVAGITTFFTMAYIVVVNPQILATEGTGLAFSAVMTATVLLSCLMTLFMGLYGDLPFSVAPGMGVNAFFAFGLVLGMGIPARQALGMVFFAGLFFVVISVTPLRESIARAIPQPLRIAGAAGIGLFILFIGLKSAGLVVADKSTFVRFGSITPEGALAVGGVFLILWLHERKNPLAMLAGIGAVTVCAALLGRVPLPKTYVSAPDFSLFFQLDVLGALKLAYLPAIVAILFTDLFDSISTFVGVSHASNLLEPDGSPKNLRKGLLVDAVATLTAGLFGSSSGTAFVESAAGIQAGGRTGYTAVFTALCFIPCLFLAPLAGSVPACATAPVLIVVGVLMCMPLRDIPTERMEDLFPVMITMALIPLTFSITKGIIVGFIFHVVLYMFAGRKKEVHPLMYGLAAFSVLLLVLEHRQ